MFNSHNKQFHSYRRFRYMCVIFCKSDMGACPPPITKTPGARSTTRFGLGCLRQGWLFHTWCHVKCDMYSINLCCGNHHMESHAKHKRVPEAGSRPNTGVHGKFNKNESHTTPTWCPYKVYDTNSALYIVCFMFDQCKARTIQQNSRNFRR